MKKTSLWLENINFGETKPLNKNIKVDVLIIGGGITGLSTAYHLIGSNLNVCLVETNTIAHGVTARTTGKLTYLQELIYSKLKKSHSETISKKYLESQIEAIKIVEDIIKKHNIDCDFDKVQSYVFSNCDEDIDKLIKEKDLLESWNIKVKEEKKIPTDVKSNYAISVQDTAVFHPLKYLVKLKSICEENNIPIYENTKVVALEKKEDTYICRTETNTIETKKIVFAVHYPYFLSPFWMPIKSSVEKSYISATKIKEIKNFSAITPKKPTISIRYQKDKNNAYSIYLSDSHNLCMRPNIKDNFADLLSQLKEKPDFIWSNKDIITNDYLPFIGRLNKTEDNLYIGTGYNTWGMTNGTIAGKLLSDLIQNKDNPYSLLFDPKRGINCPKIINFPVDLASNIKSFTQNKLSTNKSWYKDNVSFENRDGDKVAVYKDKNNIEHIVYNKCPHLKCGLLFNEVEETWDCHCHGSRFDIDGKCIEGPSNYDITYKK